MIMVTTVDGIIARNENHNTFSWNSVEDQKHFRELSKKIGTVIEGSNTFLAAKQQALKERNNIVLTRNPDKFQATDYVTFMSGSPKEVVAELEARGIKEAAIIGGATINGLFLKDNLADDIYLTIEPKLFGKGLHFSEGFELDLDLKLLSMEKLNEKGTLLLHYEILK